MLLCDARADDRAAAGKSKISNLFLVGDPKQSIYRFRRADIEVYDQSARLVGAAQRARIRQNFRSGWHIISWVNRVFSRLIEPSRDGHFQPEYVPLLPGPHAYEFPGRVVLLYPPEPDTDCKGRVDQIRYREGCCIALLIKRAVKAAWPCSRERGSLGYQDCAILLPQTTGIEQYEEAFRACGLPYHIVGGKHLYQRVEIKSLINVVTAIDNPEDAIALVGALRSPFFGCSDEDLLRHALDGGTFNYLRPNVTPAEPLAGTFELFQRLHRERNHRPVAATLLDFADATKGLELFLAKPHGAARVANLLKVIDAARSMERSGVLTFRGFARWLRERQSAREEEADSAQAESGDESVTVLTIHKSKGLEFPMTVVADLNSGEARPEERVIFDRVQGRLHLRCGPLRTAGWREAQEWDLRRVEAERRRLFYVAATRARDYLVLPVHWSKQGSKPSGMQEYLESIPNLLPPADAVPWGETIGDMAVHDTRKLPPWPKPEHAPRVKLDEAATDPAVERFLVGRAAWARNRDSVLEAARKTVPIVHASELAGPSLPPRTTVTAEPAGPEFGTLVHRLLELHLTGQIARDKIEQTARRLAADTGLSDASAASAAQLVTGALKSPTIQRLRSAKRVSFEVPFTYIDQGAIVEGRIDALAEEDAGILLVDFKSDAVDPGDEPARAEHYAPQMRAYASAVAASAGRPAREALLFFLRTNRTVPVPLS
jgi:ATP-dependent exoDNAse (exonuclease V) beta subunit